MLNYLINLNSVNKLNNAGKYKHFIYRIGKDNKNYFIENYKGVGYTSIQNLRDVYLLLLRNNKIYISNISELKHATKVNNLFYLTRKDWLNISNIIYTQTRVGTRKFLLFEKVDNLDSWLSKQVLINKIDILFRDAYYAMVGINNKLFVISDVFLCVDSYTGFSLESLDVEYIKISNINISRLNSLAGLFHCCANLKEIHFENFDTSNIVDFSRLFDNCSNLININLNELTITSKAKKIHRMFRNCYNIVDLDLNAFDISGVVNLEELFYGCSNLKNLKIDKWVLSNKCKFYDNCFTGCVQLDAKCKDDFFYKIEKICEVSD